LRTLLLELFGWLGYLERPTVVLQVLLVAGLVLATRTVRLRRLFPSVPSQGITPIALSLVVVCVLALATMGLPYALTAQLGVIWLGWYGLNLLNIVLLRWLPEARVHQLESRLLRPLYLLVAALALICRT
jgi:hypothetical protein